VAKISDRKWANLRFLPNERRNCWHSNKISSSSTLSTETRKRRTFATTPQQQRHYTYTNMRILHAQIHTRTTQIQTNTQGCDSKVFRKVHRVVNQLERPLKCVLHVYNSFHYISTWFLESMRIFYYIALAYFGSTTLVTATALLTRSIHIVRHRYTNAHLCTYALHNTHPCVLYRLVLIAICCCSARFLVIQNTSFGCYTLNVRCQNCAPKLLPKAALPKRKLKPIFA